MKLYNAIAAASFIGSFFLAAMPAEAFFWGNNKKIIGRWECEAKSPGRSGSTGVFTFSSNNKVRIIMTNDHSKEGVTIRARHAGRGRYRINGNLITVYDFSSSTENLSSIEGNSYAENIEFRKEIGDQFPEYRSRAITQDDDEMFEISTISDRYLIMQPEGGGSAEIICKK